MIGRVLQAGAGLIALASVAGCATLGGNVEGSFACRAPEGSCAPTSVIDDRALAAITGDPGSVAPRAATPAGSRSVRRERMIAPSTVRTGERVLRIVFPAFVDEAGRLHETAAVRAVVESGGWRPAAPLIAGSADEETLAAALERAGSPGMPSGDPGLPDPDAVAAARARLDPVGSIRADVDARLANTRSRGGAAPVAPPPVTTVPGRPNPATSPLPPTSTLRAPGFPDVTDGER